jgi:hypothetical protein
MACVLSETHLTVRVPKAVCTGQIIKSATVELTDFRYWVYPSWKVLHVTACWFADKNYISVGCLYEQPFLELWGLVIINPSEKAKKFYNYSVPAFTRVGFWSLSLKYRLFEFLSPSIKLFIRIDIIQAPIFLVYETESPRVWSPKFRDCILVYVGHFRSSAHCMFSL